MNEEKVPGARFCLYDRWRSTPCSTARPARLPLLAAAADPLLLGASRGGAPLSEMLQARLRTNHGPMCRAMR